MKIVAVVDADYKFIYAHMGNLGNVSDAGLFAHSDLCKAMDQGLLNIPSPAPLPTSDITMPYMFVGDDACPLRPDLIKPYPFMQMNHSQKVLNYRLSRACRVVENAFGVLADRFSLQVHNMLGARQSCTNN